MVRSAGALQSSLLDPTANMRPINRPVRAVTKDGKVIGSELIGQNFADAKYFHGRPSATTDTDPNDSTKTVPAPYNASNSAGANAVCAVSACRARRCRHRRLASE